MKRYLLIISAMVLSLVLVACDEGETSDSGSDDEATEVDAETDDSVDEEVEEEESEDEEESNENYGLGDTAEVGGIKFTVNSVSTTDERNEFADEDPEKVIKIEYEIENNSDEEIVLGMDLEVYDGTGNKMESYPLENTMDTLQPGKKTQGIEHFGIEEGPIEIYFQPAFSFDDPVIFEVDVE